MDIEMDKVHTYFTATYTNENIKLTSELVKHFSGLPFKDEKGNVIGEVVEAHIEKESIHYTVRKNKKWCLHLH